MLYTLVYVERARWEKNSSVRQLSEPHWHWQKLRTCIWVLPHYTGHMTVFLLFLAEMCDFWTVGTPTTASIYNHHQFAPELL
jgi:hypothetical protein